MRWCLSVLDRLPGRGRLALLLPGVLVGLVASDRTSGGGSEHAMMTGVMPCHAAHDRALDAAFGVGRLNGDDAECNRCEDQRDSHEMLLSMNERSKTNAESRGRFRAE